MKPNKQEYINFILDCFAKSIVERGEILAKIGEKWQTSPRTFDRYFKEAKEQHKGQQEAIKKEKLGVVIELEKEAVKRDILQKHEVLEILTQIARGNATSKKEDPPKYADRIKAIDTLVKIEGMEAVKKKEVEHKGIAPVINIISPE